MRAGRADAPAEAGCSLEHKIILQVEQLLPRADNGLRSVEVLGHQVLNFFADMLLDFLRFH